ncbi:hypothetical protein HYT51_00190 [Candidatus Woesearchaeota archaeon]|nr:hypothetical protein [Candidatus Woesearchaeota archaeon]
MKKEKLEEGLKEVLDEIENALKDKRGLLAHQRRLAFSLSLGSTILLALYLAKLNLLKEGARINHLWLRKKKEKVFVFLQNQVTSNITDVPNIGKIIELMMKIEEKRDDLAYGAPATEKILQEKINIFFALKEVVQC